ncbi:Lrp/AsnC family transcriptional regulator [Ideonella sp.]|uniref:Lrp/AsnC family transcriptional regulator n=1 Tax=Ideonella sp. TaxID=1929293 RepID=UPI0035B167CA
MSNDELDAADREILRLLQGDASLSSAALGERLALTVTACWRRRKRLEELGYITGYRAALSRARLGLGVLAFVEVRFGDQSGQSPEKFERAMQGHPEVLSCHEVSGEADYLLTVVARDLEAYGRLIERAVRRQPGVVSIKSSLALREVKAHAQLPV